METNKYFIKPGKYAARIEGWQIVEPYAAGELPTVQISFKFQDEAGAAKSVRWRGSLKEGKARAITFKSLLICGFKATSLEGLVTDENALDRNTEIEIETEMRAGKNGISYPNVKWINKLGGGKFTGLSVQQVRAALGGLDLRGDFMAAAEELGVALPGPRTQAAAAVTVDDLPF